MRPHSAGVTFPCPQYDPIRPAQKNGIETYAQVTPTESGRPNALSSIAGNSCGVAARRAGNG